MSKPSAAILTLLFLLVAIGSAGCATPPIEPTSSANSVVGIRLDIRAPIPLPVDIQQVLFVRLGEGAFEAGELPPIEAVIPSNYRTGRYFYVVDAPPGRYAVAVAMKRESGEILERPAVKVGNQFRFTESRGRFDDTYTVYFSEALFRASLATAAPGSIAFLGDYTAHTDAGLIREPS